MTFDILRPFDEVRLPTPENCPVGGLGRAPAEHNVRRDEVLAAQSDARRLRAQGPSVDRQAVNSLRKAPRPDKSSAC